MKKFLRTPEGKASLALGVGLLLVAWPPSLAWLAAGAAFTYAFVTIRRVHRRVNAPITLTYRSNEHE